MFLTTPFTDSEIHRFAINFAIFPRISSLFFLLFSSTSSAILPIRAASLHIAPSTNTSTTIKHQDFFTTSSFATMASRVVLRGRIEKKGGKRSSLNNRRSALLNMPVDLIHEITNELSPADKIIFASTCRPIRNTIGRSQFPSDTYENQEERFEYLAGMCRDMPNHWVCEQCMRYHRIDISDTPAGSCSTCPLATSYGRYNQPLKLSPGVYGYNLGRRHVQLALKYTRMGDSLPSPHRLYLRRLMAARQYSLLYSLATTAMVTAKIIPRIVQGRFLLGSICEYRQSSRPVSKDLIGDGCVCPHQQYFRWQDDAWSNNIFPESVRQFHKAVNDSFETPGKEIRGHCPHCFTDFSVTTTQKCIRLSVWVDLGTESSPLDPVWRSLAYCADLHPTDKVEYNEPGRVRELYSSEVEE